MHDLALDGIEPCLSRGSSWPCFYIQPIVLIMCLLMLMKLIYFGNLRLVLWESLVAQQMVLFRDFQLHNL